MNIWIFLDCLGESILFNCYFISFSKDFILNWLLSGNVFLDLSCVDNSWCFGLLIGEDSNLSSGILNGSLSDISELDCFGWNGSDIYIFRSWLSDVFNSCLSGFRFFDHLHIGSLSSFCSSCLFNINLSFSLDNLSLLFDITNFRFFTIFFNQINFGYTTSSIFNIHSNLFIGCVLLNIHV